MNDLLEENLQLRTAVSVYRRVVDRLLERVGEAEDGLSDRAEVEALVAAAAASLAVKEAR
jgi:hypothetical protein